jgi:SAM-dependent methyltransferase
MSFTLRPSAHAHGPSGGPLSLYDDAEIYDAIVPPGPCEPFYRNLARRAAGPILELACGTGRLTLPIAQDGHEVVGLDASPAMLAAARRKADGQGLDVGFVEGDMRDFDLGRRFGLVILSCNSLSHLTEPRDLLAALAAVRRHLRPRGLFAFDVVLPDPRDLARCGAGPRRLDLGPNPGSAIEAEEEIEYDPVRQLRIGHWRIRSGPGGAMDFAPLVQRQFFPHEIPLLLAASGLELEARHGDFESNPLSAWSLNQICVARPSPGA